MAAPLNRTFHKQFRRKYATCYGLNYGFGQIHIAFAIKNLRNNQNFCLQLLIRNKLLERLNQTNVAINMIAATPPVTFLKLYPHLQGIQGNQRDSNNDTDRFVRTV